MQRPHRRLESNKYNSFQSLNSTSLSDISILNSSSVEDVFDEEAGVKGKTVTCSTTAVSALGTGNRLTALLLGCCMVILLILKVATHGNNVFANGMPASLASFLENELSHQGMQKANSPFDSTLFYTSQPANIRYCNSSIARDAVTHRSGVSDPLSESGVTVVIYAGESRFMHPGYQNFKTSLDLTGFTDIHIIEPPSTTREINKYTHANFSGEANFWKERLQYFYQKTQEFPSHKILLFCDAFDTMFTQPPSTLIKRFELFSSDIVFSTEILCDTVSCRRDLWLKDFFITIAPPTNPYKYINAGMFMGRASALGEFMLCALGYANNGRDDQTAFSHCFREFYLSGNQNAHLNTSAGTSRSVISAVLDYDSVLFGNLPPVSSLFEQAWDFQTSRADASYEIFEIPFLYRKHNIVTPLTKFPLFYSPVAIHFPGIAYRPSLREQWFNPCQQFLKWRYNEIGETIFKSGRIPNLAYGFVSKENRQGDTRESLDASSGEGILTKASYTVFDINEVYSRNHQELWLAAFFSGQKIDFTMKWEALKRETEMNSKIASSITDISKDTKNHISSTLTVTEKKIVNEQMSSRVSKLFQKRFSKVNFDQSKGHNHRRVLSEDKVNGHVFQDIPSESVFMQSLFEQKRSYLQPERIVLMETLEVNCHMESNELKISADTTQIIISQLSQHLCEHLESVHDNNIYWRPDRIVFRIKLLLNLIDVFEDLTLRSMERQILEKMKEITPDIEGVDVLCIPHTHLDSSFFGILKNENADTVFVMLEKEINFSIASDETNVAYLESVVQSSEDMHSSMPVSLPLPQLYLDTLLKTFMRTPIYAYGFSGLFIESKDHSEVNTATEFHLRSTNHLVDKSPIAVDMLNLRGGLTFRRGMLYTLRSDFDFLSSMADSPQCQCTSESLLVSAILSRNQIRRVHVPYEGVFNVNRKVYSSSKSEIHRPRDVDQLALSHCIKCLLPTFQRDWIYSSPDHSASAGYDTQNSHTSYSSSSSISDRRSQKYSEKESSVTCTTPFFEMMPHIDNLPGFSFQPNWDPVSATSPCTQHLMTRYEDSAGLLGTGQFMTENQTMLSPRKSDDDMSFFMIKLVSGARLCSYKVFLDDGGYDSFSEASLLSCLLPPSPLNEHIAHYAAVTNGELCFYEGIAPHFGGTKQDSLHRQLAWCTAPVEMNIKTYESAKGTRTKLLQAPHHTSLFKNSRTLHVTDTNSSADHSHRQLSRSQVIGELVRNAFKKRSHDVIMHRVQAKCIMRVISPVMYPNTYLHVDARGTFGLFISPQISPSEIVLPSTRISSLRRARCFKKFEKKGS